MKIHALKSDYREERLEDRWIETEDDWVEFHKKEGLPKWVVGGGVVTKSTPLFKYPESIEWFIKDEDFRRCNIWLLAHPLTTLPAAHTARKTEKERRIAEEREGEDVGQEPNHTTARNSGPL